MADSSPYTADSSEDRLYSLDSVTGEVISDWLITGRLAGHPSGVASHDGELYVTTYAYDGSDYQGRLYRADLDTLTFAQIGDVDFGVGEGRPHAIASHGNPTELYMIGDETDALHNDRHHHRHN